MMVLGGEVVSYERGTPLQGYFAHKKTPPPLTRRGRWVRRRPRSCMSIVQFWLLVVAGPLALACLAALHFWFPNRTRSCVRLWCSAIRRNDLHSDVPHARPTRSTSARWIVGENDPGCLSCSLLVAGGTNQSPYGGYSKLRTHTALGSYGRAVHRSIGPP